MGKYDDLINLPHHVSKNHPQMSNYNRAAQFAPFAALVGYEEELEKSKENLVSKIELSEENKEEIMGILRKISSKCGENPLIEVKYFVLKDKEKGLGKYITYQGNLKKIDEYLAKLIFTNRKSIYLKDIYQIKEVNNE